MRVTAITCVVLLTMAIIGCSSPNGDPPGAPPIPDDPGATPSNLVGGASEIRLRESAVGGIGPGVAGALHSPFGHSGCWLQVGTSERDEPTGHVAPGNPTCAPRPR